MYLINWPSIIPKLLNHSKFIYIQKNKTNGQVALYIMHLISCAQWKKEDLLYQLHNRR